MSKQIDDEQAVQNELAAAHHEPVCTPVGSEVAILRAQLERARADVDLARSDATHWRERSMEVEANAFKVLDERDNLRHTSEVFRRERDEARAEVARILARRDPAPAREDGPPPWAGPLPEGLSMLTTQHGTSVVVTASANRTAAESRAAALRWVDTLTATAREQTAVEAAGRERAYCMDELAHIFGEEPVFTEKASHLAARVEAWLEKAVDAARAEGRREILAHWCDVLDRVHDGATAEGLAHATRSKIVDAEAHGRDHGRREGREDAVEWLRRTAGTFGASGSDGSSQAQERLLVLAAGMVKHFAATASTGAEDDKKSPNEQCSEPFTRGTCGTCGTTWLATEPLPCPACPDLSPKAAPPDDPPPGYHVNVCGGDQWDWCMEAGGEVLHCYDLIRGCEPYESRSAAVAACWAYYMGSPATPAPKVGDLARWSGAGGDPEDATITRIEPHPFYGSVAWGDWRGDGDECFVPVREVTVLRPAPPEPPAAPPQPDPSWLALGAHDSKGSFYTASQALIEALAEPYDGSLRSWLAWRDRLLAIFTAAPPHGGPDATGLLCAALDYAYAFAQTDEDGPDRDLSDAIARLKAAAQTFATPEALKGPESSAYERGRDDCTAAVIDMLLHPPGYVGEGSPLWKTIREEVVLALRRGVHHDRMAPKGESETPEGRALAAALRDGVDEPTAALAWSGPEYHAQGNPPPAVLEAVREAYPAMVRVHPVARVVERVIPPVTSEYEESTEPVDDVSGEQGWFADVGDDALLRELGAHVREAEAFEPMVPDCREALLDLVIAPPLEPPDPEETERRVDAVLTGRTPGAGT